MPKLNTTVKSVRIDNDKLEELEKILGGRSINAWLNEKILESVGGKPAMELPYGIDQKDLDDLKTMVGFGCGSVGEIIHLIDKGLNDGSLVLESGRIIGRPEVDLDKFLDVCHDFGKDPQKMLDKMIEKIMR